VPPRWHETSAGVSPQLGGVRGGAEGSRNQCGAGEICGRQVAKNVGQDFRGEDGQRRLLEDGASSFVEERSECLAHGFQGG